MKTIDIRTLNGGRFILEPQQVGHMMAFGAAPSPDGVLDVTLVDLVEIHAALTAYLVRYQTAPVPLCEHCRRELHDE